MGDETKAVPEQAHEAIVFVGETLGPLFLHEPDSEEAAPFYQALRATDAQAAAIAWPFTAEKDACEAFALLHEGLADGVSEPLADEFRRLFVGPARKAAPPWGSVYTDRDCVMHGASTLSLRQWMRGHGISIALDDGAPEDHVGLMLLLMAWLARSRPELLPEYLEWHLLPWVPHFLGVVQVTTVHPFFQGLAQLTAATLAGIQDELVLDVVVPRFYR